MTSTATGPTPTSPIAAFGAKLQRAFSRDSTLSTSSSASSGTKVDGNGGGGSVGRKVVEYDPFLNRGREHLPRHFTSSGRGGAGNIHRSQSRDEQAAAAAAGGEIPRGREAPALPAHGGEPTHVGRGGMGNVARSPSRGPEAATPANVLAYEQNVIETHDQNAHTFSTGRGGAGNIRSPSNSRSRSRVAAGGPDGLTRSSSQGLGGTPEERSQSRGRGVHSFGRGGAGNIHAHSLVGTGRPGIEEEELAELDEIERLKYLAAGGGEKQNQQHHGHGHGNEMHSTGRGGLANVTAMPAPPPDAVVRDRSRDAESAYYSTGRGGAGNIRDRSASRPRVGA